MSSPAKPAFPSELAECVDSLSSLLTPPAERPCSSAFPVQCARETLLLPRRIYFPVPSDRSFHALDPLDHSVVACWFTRHHDGRVREHFLRAVAAFDREWIIAYVIALCGEYVVEILQYIWEHRDLFDLFALGQFLRDNPLLYAQTQSRIVSYWNCYYRALAPRFTDYVGSNLLAFLDDSLTQRHVTPNA